MKITAKFKIADLEDIFYGDIRKGASPHWLKPNIHYCLLEDNKLQDVLVTPDAPDDLKTFTYYLQLVFEKKILIPNNYYSSSEFIKEITLKSATEETLRAFCCYYYINHNEVSGPYILEEDFWRLNPNYYKNKPIIQAFNQGLIYVIGG